MSRKTTMQRLTARVELVDAGMATPCILYQGYRTPGGHGLVRHAGKSNRRAHRVAWESQHGAIPPRHIILHRCPHKHCLEVAHMELGTPEDHVALRQEQNRQARGEAQGSAKLTRDQVLEIVARIRAGEKLAKIALRYGVHRTAIGFIKRGLTWSHVTGIEPREARKAYA